MKNYWKINSDPISSRWPNLFRLIGAAQAPEQVLLEQVREETLSINGIHLSSCYNRLGDVQLQARQIPENASMAWLYGPGIGDLPRFLLGRENLQQLNIVPLNLAAFRQALIYFRQDDWLSDPRVVLHDPAGQKTVLHPFCANPACIQLAGRDIGRLKDMLILELSTDYINRRIATNPALIQQLKNNRERIRHDLDVGLLFQSAPGSVACVAAAGPTLSEHYDRLKKRESKGPLIAVDAALKPLLDNDIIPDIVVSIDPRRNTIMACFDVDLARLRAASLVYFPVVHPDILDQWQGRRYVAYSTSPIYDEIKSELSRRALFSSGSVIHPAVDLAVRMGCKRIELCGADFGFPDGETYVKGSPVGKAYKDSNKSVVWVTNGRGEEIKSTRQFRGYQLDFEKYIEAHPEVEFVNGSDKGAHIMGTSSMLKEC